MAYGCYKKRERGLAELEWEEGVFILKKKEPVINDDRFLIPKTLYLGRFRLESIAYIDCNSICVPVEISEVSIAAAAAAGAEAKIIWTS